VKVSRSDPGGAVYLSLQRQARATGRPVQELFDLYVLEAFLDRLSRSTLRDDFVLKGGVLLSAFGQRRPTRDVDLQAQAIKNDAETVRALIVDVAGTALGDGVEFVTSGATAVVIREEDAYSGVRISMVAELAAARIQFHIDVSVGDPISPPPLAVQLPRLLGGSISVRGYPLEMVCAEKIVTAVARGTANTRWRDFLDVVLLSTHHDVDGDTLAASVQSVASHRSIALEPLAMSLAGFGSIGQVQWTAWRRKQGVEDRSPESFGDLLGQFIAFADPAVLGVAAGMRWSSLDRQWRP
jgi:predicted nucleotidyltransferase component of viral defense system